MSYDYDPELPAGYQDADLMQAAYESEANARSAQRRQGYCLHSSWVGLPDSGEIFYPAQEGLEPGQVRCTEECGQVFANDAAIMDAAPVKVR